VQDIAKLSKLLVQCLTRFAFCFAPPAGRTLLQIYIRGLLSDVQRKNAEAIALDQNVALAYSAPRFDCLLDARLYLPEEWASDSTRRKKRTCRTMSSSRRNLKLHWI